MLLAIDTATRLIGIALHNGHTLVAEHSWYTANQHSVELAPAIAEMLHQAQVPPHALQGIAVAQGPGSFTGLRIGLAVAKAMAQTLQIALIPVPTFEIVAQATPYFKGTLHVVVHAGRGRVHIQRYRWKKGGWEGAGDPFNSDWASFVKSLDHATLVTGEIDVTILNLLQEQAAQNDKISIAPPSQRLRRPGVLAEIAYPSLNRTDLPDPVLITPIYLKTP